MATTALISDFIVKSGLIVQGTGTVTSSTGQITAAQINGGAAIAKNLIVGTTSTVHGDSTVYGNLHVTGTSYLSAVDISGALDLTTATLSGALTVGGLSSLNGGLTVTNATYLGGTLTVAGASTFNNSVSITGANTLTVGTGTTTLGGLLSVTGKTVINNNTAATFGGGGDGALKVVGGVYVGNNLQIASTAFDTSTNTANALYVAGGAWVDKTLVVGGDTTFKGSVTFTGTATYVLSTNTVYTDNILHLHENPSGPEIPWVIDDGKDIGLAFHYYKGADKNAFLGFANDTSYLEWYEDGTETGGKFTSGTYGTFKTANIQLVGTGAASSTITGALQVAGGVGIGGAVYAGGNVSGGSVTARDLTNTRLVIAGTGGQLTDDADLTWNGTANQIEGRIAYANTASLATTATNASTLLGGTPGAVVYQSNTGTTAFLSIGSSGYVLQSNGSAPVWGPMSGVAAGTAVTATNIAGGLTNQIPYQSAPGVTAFSPSLTFNGTTFATSNVSISGTTNSLNNTSTQGALVVSGGVSIAKDLFVAGNINLLGDFNSVSGGFNKITGTTGTFDYVIIEGTGTGLTVNNNASIGGTLSVTGETTLSTATISNATITNLTVTGVTSLQGTTVTTLTATNLVSTTLNVSAQSTLQNLTAAVTTVTSLAVTGSAGVTVNLLVGGTGTFTGEVYANDTTNATSTNTGALQVQGGIGVANSIYAGGSGTFNGKVYANDTTDSASTNSGSIITQGGVGVAKSMTVGGQITVGTPATNSVVPAIFSNNTLISSFTSNTITSASTQNLDSFSGAVYRTARYLIQVFDNVAGVKKVHVSEITVFHDDNNVYLDEYGISTNTGQLGTFDASYITGTLTLNFTPNYTPTAMVIKIMRTAITI